MPAVDIVRRSEIKDSFRVKQVVGMFDMPESKAIENKWSVDLPVFEKPWDIGLIVGPSGSGKTTIASEVFKDCHIHSGFEWSEDASILDGFPESMTTKEVVTLLSSVGLSSPPHWLKPFKHLSNGQKFRVELARLLSSDHDVVVFDEFTSVVDRDVAKVCCSALAKTIRRRQRPHLVALSCHFDIIDWLQPDWMYEVGSGCFEWRSLRRRPSLKLQVYRTHVSMWGMFRGHHYLSGDIHKQSQCYVGAINGKPVAFTAVLHFPHPKIRNAKREHRTVVLPDYQGLGIGNKMSEFIGELLAGQGFKFYSTTGHPAMIGHRTKSPRWRNARKVGHSSGFNKTSMERLGAHAANGRITAGFEYLPEKDQGVQALGKKAVVQRMLNETRTARKTKANLMRRQHQPPRQTQ